MTPNCRPLESMLDDLAQRRGRKLDPTVRTWHLLIGGFTQRLGEPTGMHTLWTRLRCLLADERTQVEHHPWNAQWAAIAEAIKISRNGHGVRVFVYAYSWGAGWGFVRLARELGKRGIEVEGAVLCDPVWRSRLVSLRWLSLTGYPAIVVPPNVREVWWLRQRTNFPRAHEVVASSNQTLVHSPTYCAGVVHSSMDEHPIFFADAVNLAIDSLEEPPCDT